MVTESNKYTQNLQQYDKMVDGLKPTIPTTKVGL